MIFDDWWERHAIQNSDGILPIMKKAFRELAEDAFKEGEENTAYDLINEKDYDSGLLNNYGGGNVDWWFDYIRSEINRCNEYWRSRIEQFISE